jgi:3-hydroxyisobutyrate dehydrogenase-like beta-hydroxyacid dehydrogenase
MGISVGAAAQNSGIEVYWASAGRSDQTRARAEEHALLDAGSLEALVQSCDIIISVCPPHAAEEVAGKVLDHDFAGLFVDANAISPQRAVRIGEQLEAGGVTFVDGGIVGGPAWEPGRTWLYLSGATASRVADCFNAGPLETTVLGDNIGQASALKMCFAAWTKGSTALLCGILATADKLEVWEPLAVQWERYWPGFPEEAESRTRRVTAKAWRFAGEMEEIAATFSSAGLPGGFHEAAAEIYRRTAHFKDAEEVPALEKVLGTMQGD